MSNNNELLDEALVHLRAINAVLTRLSGAPDAANAGEPAAWMHEFMHPLNGERTRTVLLNKPKDYELQPGDSVRPLYLAADESTRAPDELLEELADELRNTHGIAGDVEEVVELIASRILAAPPSGERPSAPAPEGEKHE